MCVMRMGWVLKYCKRQQLCNKTDAFVTLHLLENLEFFGIKEKAGRTI